MHIPTYRYRLHVCLLSKQSDRGVFVTGDLGTYICIDHVILLLLYCQTKIVELSKSIINMLI